MSLPLVAAIEQWNRDWPRNKGALTYRRGPGFLTITDTRSTAASPLRLTLTKAEAEVSLACDAGATLASIRRTLAAASTPRLSETALIDLLAALVEVRVLYEEDGRFLSLAVPAAASWGAVHLEEATRHVG